MQYPKDEIKRRILEAALNEFMVQGYRGASMRRIAQGADIALGNVYHYCDGKQALFGELVGPVYARVVGAIRDIEKIDFREANRYDFGSVDGDDSAIAINQLMGNILKLCAQHSAELMLLMVKAEGSGEPYEHARRDLGGLIEAVLAQKMLPNLRDRGVQLSDDRMCGVLAGCFTQGFCQILALGVDGDQVMRLTGRLINILFQDIAARV